MYRKIQSDPQFLLEIFSTPNTPSHILFDCDGLILDTEPIYTQVALQTIRTLLSDHSKDFTDHRLFPLSVKQKVMGGDKFQVARFMSQHLNNTFNLQITPEDWIRHTEPLETALFALGCKLMPAVSDLVRLFIENEYPVAVATSSSRQSFTVKSKLHAKLFSSFPVITCGDDLDYSSENENQIMHDKSTRRRVQGKPHPSIFSTARHHLNRSPSHHGLVLEDSPNGVVAALRSGHSCIWVPDKSLEPGFHLIDNVFENLKNVESIDPNLFVYRATSLHELLNVLKK